MPEDASSCQSSTTPRYPKSRLRLRFFLPQVTFCQSTCALKMSAPGAYFQIDPPMEDGSSYDHRDAACDAVRGDDRVPLSAATLLLTVARDTASRERQQAGKLSRLFACVWSGLVVMYGPT